MIEYQYSVNQKLIIMNGIFHNIECGMILLKRNTALGDLDAHHMMANPFLSAVIFELAIKSMWELSHSKVWGKAEIKDYGHHIDSVYPCLREDFRDFISNKYDAEVANFCNTLQEILNSDQSGEGYTEDERAFILSCPYFSLTGCLEENKKIIIHGKYEFQPEPKINVITGIIPNSSSDQDHVNCCRQPSPFLKEIVNYIQTQLHPPPDFETFVLREESKEVTHNAGAH